MSITFQLPNFPLLNQNSEDPGREFPDVNAGMDCVPTSIAAALTWFSGRQYYGDQLIDQNPNYGASYHGGTAAVAYISQAAAAGVHLYSVDGNPAQLVADLHALVHQNKPCLITIPGQWNNPATSGANPGPVTHVCVVCGDGPGEIRAMNPWGGFMMDVSDAWLVNKLCYGQIWPMERATVQLSDVSTFFEDDGNGNWRCKQNGCVIIGGLLQAYQTWPANGSQNGLTAFGLPQTNEIPVPGQPSGVVYQVFERGVLVWDMNHSYDTPPGVTASAYAAHMALGLPAAPPSPVVPPPAPPPVVDQKAAAAKAALQAWLEG